MTDKNKTNRNEEHARPYNFRVHEPTAGKALPKLMEAHQQYNETTSRLEDFLLTVRGGAPASAGSDRKSRLRVALSWLNVESAHDPMAQFGGPRITVEDPIEALRSMLENANVPDYEIWLRDCDLAFKVPLRDDAVWVNRRKMFERDLPHVKEEQILGFLNRAHKTYFTGKPEEKETEKKGKKKKKKKSEKQSYTQTARGVLSTAFGSGRKKDYAFVRHIAATTLAYLNELEDRSPTSAEALPEILAKANAEEPTFYQEFGTGRSSTLCKWLRAHEVPLEEREKLQEELFDPWTEKVRDEIKDICRAEIKKCDDKLQEDLSWMSPFKDKFFPEMPYTTSGANPMMVTAMAAVFSHHTKISNQEMERHELAEKATQLDAKLKAHPKAVEFLTQYQEDRRAQLDRDTYRIAPRAVTGWSQVHKEFKEAKDQEEREKIAKTLPHRQRKAGDVRLFSALASDEAKVAWPVLTDFTNWMDHSTRSAERSVPMFCHRDLKQGTAWMQFGSGNNAWRIDIEEKAQGKHVATLYLFNDQTRKITVNIRNARADKELLFGQTDIPADALGRHGSLGTIPADGRPYVGGTSLKKLSWMLMYQHGVPYLKFTPRLRPIKTRMSSTSDELTYVVGIDLGLQAQIAYAIAKVVPNAEELFAQHADTLREYAYPVREKEEDDEKDEKKEKDDEKGEKKEPKITTHKIAVVGTVEGKEVFFRRIGWDKKSYRWVQFVDYGAIHAQGHGNDRKTSNKEFHFVVNLMKRANKRTPVKARLSRAQWNAVDAMKLIVRSHKFLAKLIHALRKSRDSAIADWKRLCEKNADYRVRKEAARLWERTFGELPNEDSTPKGALPKRLEEVADALEQLWQQNDEELGALVGEVEQWVAPSNGDFRARGAGGLTDRRLEIINRLRGLVSAWEGRPTPTDPKGQRFRDWRPPRLKRLDDYLQRKKEEQKKQAIAELFCRVRGRCDVLVSEDLQMQGDQRQTRRQNRLGARLAPSQQGKLLADRCSLEGVNHLEASPYWTSQFDLRTGAPALRCSMISVEQFVTHFSYLAKAGAQSSNRGMRKPLQKYLEDLIAQWNPDTKIWTDGQGRKWKLKSQVPRLRWEGPGEHPPHVYIPHTHGQFLLSMENNRLRFADADLHASGNILLARMGFPWRQQPDNWDEELTAQRTAILKALRKRELCPAKRKNSPAPRRARSNHQPETLPTDTARRPTAFSSPMHMLKSPT